MGDNCKRSPEAESLLVTPNLRRLNMLNKTSERWRPPLFVRSDSRMRGVLDALRRSADLQAASIWEDLRLVLRNCRGKVLDVGCGAQPYRRLLPQGAIYIGADTVQAKEHFGYEIPETRYFAGDVWPCADSEIDTVLATETLEHVEDPVRFLSEAYRCLKPGGELILTVPFAARWHYIPHDYWRFTPKGLEILLRKVGFADISVYARGNEVSVACYKFIGILLPLLVGRISNAPKLLVSRCLGLLATPILLISAVFGRLSLCSEGGDDCLGYTVIAKRSAHAKAGCA